MPRIAILMPCWNAEAFLDDAARSIEQQTFEDFEVIAVDDGSTDDTPGRLAGWAARDPRVRVLTTPHRGIVDALCTAAAEAQSPLLARMDADDIAHPRRLETQLALLDADPTIAGCGTRIRYVPRHAVREGARRYEQWINSVVTPGDIVRDLFVECPIPHPTLTVRRDAFIAAGGYQDRGWPEDYDLVLRMHEAGLRLAKLPEILLDWRESRHRLSRTADRYGPERFRACKVHYLRRLRLAGRDAAVWGAGPVGKAFARSLVAAGTRVVAFIDIDPRKIGQAVYGIPVLEPARIGEIRGSFVVAAVGSTTARAEIRGALSAAGWAETTEFCAVA